jgi:hypothetical protein
VSQLPATTDFEVEPVDPARSAALLQIHELHTGWTAQQLATDKQFHPDEHPAHSDYNLHSPDLDADGGAEDDLANAVAEILSGQPGSAAGPGEARRRLTGR